MSSSAAAEVLPLRPPRKTSPPTAPAGFATALVVELAQAIIRLSAEDPGLIAQVREALGVLGATTTHGRLLMRKSEYADHVGYSVRTLDKLIDAGLPTRGRGKLLRVVVADANDWLLTQDVANLDEVELLAIRNARKRTQRGEQGG